MIDRQRDRQTNLLTQYRALHEQHADARQKPLKNFLNFKNLKSERYISEPRFAGVKFSLIRRRILYVTACSLGVEGVSLFTTHAGLVGVFANKQHLDRRTLRRPRRRVIMMYRVVLGERPVAVITAAAAACDNTTN